MPTTYTPDDTNNPETITLPSDLDDLTAEAFNAAYRALADKSAFALTTKAALGALNAFSRGQKIEPPTEDEAVLQSRRFPGQISADNRWALVFKFDIETNRSIRMYTGAVQGIGRLAWTQNAVWNMTDQQWEQEDPDTSSAAVLWITAAMTWHYVPSGTDPFANWPTTGTSNLEGSLKTVGEFRYATAKSRTRTIPVASASGPIFVSGADGSVGTEITGDHSLIRWPIRLSFGSVLQSVSVLHNINSSAVETFKITRRRTVWDPGSLSLPSESIIVSTDSDSSTGPHITTLTTNISVDRFDELSLLWVPSGGLLNNVHAITMTFSDPGPGPIG